jgi:hypothetical protein
MIMENKIKPLTKIKLFLILTLTAIILYVLSADFGVVRVGLIGAGEIEIRSLLIFSFISGILVATMLFQLRIKYLRRTKTIDKE